jgi:hypothetical protein
LLRSVGVPASDAVLSTGVERGKRLRRRLLGADVLSVALAAAMATLLLPLSRFEVTAQDQLLAALLCLPVLIALLQGTGLYHQMERTLDPSFVYELKPVVLATSAWTLNLLFATAVIAQKPVRPVWFAIFGLLLIACILIGRAITRRIASKRPWFRQRTVLLGDSLAAGRVARRIERHPETGLDVVGVIPAGANGAVDGESEGDPLGLVEVLHQKRVQRVVLSGWQATLEERTELIRVLVTSGFYVDLVSGEPEALTAGASIQHVEGLPMVTISPTPISRVGRAGKRGLDVVRSCSDSTGWDAAVPCSRCSSSAPWSRGRTRCARSCAESFTPASCSSSATTPGSPRSVERSAPGRSTSSRSCGTSSVGT